MSSFPIIKLVSLTIKQLSKPMASYIKRKSKSNYWLRTYLCTPPAQVYHRWDVRLRLWSTGARLGGHKFKVPPLTEARAIDEGADLLGELFIMSVAAGVIYMEYHRQSVNAAKKDESQDLSLTRLNKDVLRLQQTITEQDADISEIIRLFEVMHNKQISSE